MDMLVPRFSYVFLTDVLPSHAYELNDRYTLKPIISTFEMFRGVFLDIDEKYNVLLTLPYIDNDSYSIYKDLVIFHTFISDNNKTYEFAENATEICLENSGLVFTEDLSNIDLGKVTILDFNLFPIYTNLDMTKPVMQFNDEISIRYSTAFDLFLKLKSNETTKRLYDLICLFVFLESLESLTRIYSNTYIKISFYIAILESLIGRPTTCEQVLTCPKCGRKVEHPITSFEEHFTKHYDKQFKKLRDIRHKTFHEGKYFDLIEYLLTEIYANQDETNKTSSRNSDLTIEITNLELTVQDLLMKQFLEKYKDL